MTPRRCPSCGVLEQRTKDSFGRETTNLYPLTGMCIRCLVNSVKAKPMPGLNEPFDPKRLAANDRED